MESVLEALHLSQSCMYTCHTPSLGNFATDAVLSAIRSALASLTVQDCPMLTVQGLKSLSRHCHQTLVSLDISRCTSIKHCSVSELHVWFPKLTTLECSLPPFPSDAQVSYFILMLSLSPSTSLPFHFAVNSDIKRNNWTTQQGNTNE